MSYCTQEFLRLVQENPDLPIVPMVNGELVCDDGYNYWLGSFGSSEINEWVCVDDHFYTRNEQDEVEDVLSDRLCDDYPELSDEEFFRVIHERLEALPWKKAIIVYIGLPEVD